MLRAASARPLVRARDGGFILAVPGMVLPALTRHVERQLASLVPVEASTPISSLWADIERSLGLLQMERHTGADHDPGLVAHRVYRVDEQQLLAAALNPGSTDDPPRFTIPDMATGALLNGEDGV